MTGLLEAVLPSIGVGLIFWFAMRAIVRADRNERNAVAELEAKDAERAHFSADAPGQNVAGAPDDAVQNSSAEKTAAPDTNKS